MWDERKGLADFIKLADLLREDEEIVLVGLSEKQMLALPKDKRIRGIKRTESQEELAALYSAALCFVNPTYEDTFPTTNLEALACGTPVVTYRTGGSPEAVDEETGFVVEPDDMEEIRSSLDKLKKMDSIMLSSKCRNRAEQFFNKNECFKKYMRLYKEK